MGNRKMNKNIFYLIATCWLVVVQSGFFYNVNGQILIIRPQGRDFVDAVKGLSDDIGGDTKIFETVLGTSSKDAEIENALQTYSPTAIVLMDNISISYYKRYCKSLKSNSSMPPSIALMGILVGHAISGINNSEAISYEIPVVTSIVNLRLLTGSSVDKVGIVHRELMNELVDQNRPACLREKISIIDKTIPNRSTDTKQLLNKAITALIESDIDVLWVPNDNILLSPELLAKIWIPIVNKYKKPVIVGIETLASPELNFGIMAVVPDHVALGAQAASLIISARDNNWKVNTGTVEPPISVYKILNMKKAKELFNIKRESCKNIDKILE
jgi:hypothetical protein